MKFVKLVILSLSLLGKPWLAQAQSCDTCPDPTSTACTANYNPNSPSSCTACGECDSSDPVTCTCTFPDSGTPCADDSGNAVDAICSGATDGATICDLNDKTCRTPKCNEACSGPKSTQCTENYVPYSQSSCTACTCDDSVDPVTCICGVPSEGTPCADADGCSYQPICIGAIDSIATLCKNSGGGYSCQAPGCGDPCYIDYPDIDQCRFNEKCNVCRGDSQSFYTCQEPLPICHDSCNDDNECLGAENGCTSCRYDDSYGYSYCQEVSIDEASAPPSRSPSRIPSKKPKGKKKTKKTKKGPKKAKVQKRARKAKN